MTLRKRCTYYLKTRALKSDVKLTVGVSLAVVRPSLAGHKRRPHSRRPDMPRSYGMSLICPARSGKANRLYRRSPDCCLLKWIAALNDSDFRIDAMKCRSVVEPFAY